MDYNCFDIPKTVQKVDIDRITFYCCANKIKVKESQKWQLETLVGQNFFSTHLGSISATGIFSRAALSSIVSFPSDMIPTPLAIAFAVIG